MTTFNLARNTGVGLGPAVGAPSVNVMKSVTAVVNISGIIAANSGTTVLATTDLVRAITIPPYSYVVAIGARVEETNVSGAFTISAATITYASGHMATSGHVVNLYEAGAQLGTVVASATGALWTTGSSVDVVFTLTSGATLTYGKVAVYAIYVPLYGGPHIG